MYIKIFIEALQKGIRVTEAFTSGEQRPKPREKGNIEIKILEFREQNYLFQDLEGPLLMAV